MTARRKFQQETLAKAYYTGTGFRLKCFAMILVGTTISQYILISDIRNEIIEAIVLDRNVWLYMA